MYDKCQFNLNTVWNLKLPHDGKFTILEKTFRRKKPINTLFARHDIGADNYPNSYFQWEHSSDGPVVRRLAHLYVLERNGHDPYRLVFFKAFI